MCQIHSPQCQDGMSAIICAHGKTHSIKLTRYFVCVIIVVLLKCVLWNILLSLSFLALCCVFLCLILLNFRTDGVFLLCEIWFYFSFNLLFHVLASYFVWCPFSFFSRLIACAQVVCGSYRRGKADCGDIDCLFTNTAGDSVDGLLTEMVTRLKATGFILADLTNISPLKALGGPAHKSSEYSDKVKNIDRKKKQVMARESIAKEVKSTWSR